MMPKKGFSAKNIENVRKGPGVYRLFNSEGVLTYVGKAKNLQERLEQHLNQEYIPNVRQFNITPTDTTREAEKMEKNIIERFKPIHNEQQ
jgi:excinuclease ABC subunit C